MTDLAADLAALRLERHQPTARPWRWPVLLMAATLLLAAGVYGVRAWGLLAGAEVQLVGAVAAESAGSEPVGAPILTASGYLVARRKAEVSAKIQGRLAELHVEEGSRVRRGEVLARLESGEFEAQVERTRAAVQRAEADLAEQQRQCRLAEALAAEGLVALDLRDAARSRVTIADAVLRQARADLDVTLAGLENTCVRAPFSGTVVRRMAEVGESVAPIPSGVNNSTSSGAILTLADLETIEVEADVSEASIARLQQGQPAEVNVEAFPDRQLRGVLRQVIPTADRTKATVQVKVSIVEKQGDLKPEMSAKVTFLERENRPAAQNSGRPAVAVPKDTVTIREGRAVVFDVRDGRARQRPVVVGAEREGRAVVTSGVSAGESLIARPPKTLRDGDAVRIKRQR